MDLRSVTSVILILIVAFSFGYKRESFGTYYQDLKNRIQRRAEVKTEAASPVAETERRPPAPAPAANRGAQQIPPPVANSGPYAAIAAPSQAPPGVNLEQALDAVRPAELSDEMRAQRNVYFDRLQQQLQEMRQQQPPEQNTVEAPAIPVIPAPVQPFNQQTHPGAYPPVVPGAYPPAANANGFPLVPPPNLPEIQALEGREPFVKGEQEERDEADVDVAEDDPIPDEPEGVEEPLDDEDG